jgi:hypothetical protein
MRMKTRRQLVGEKGDPVGLVRLGGLPDDTWVLPKGSHELALAFVSQKREVGLGERLLSEIKVLKDGLALP